MADLVTLTIDGIEVSVPKGTLVVEAARQVGIQIPVFCYHSRLDPVGMCRMCLVEVGTPRLDPQTRQPVIGPDGRPAIAMMPKLQTACTLTVSPGMVVVTRSPAVADARQAILEFLLTSHPLDCPICDKGGECPLQELTFAYGPGVSRFPLEDKYHLAKRVPLGPLIVLDRERCIQCARCIRFQDELVDDPVLGFYDRGRGMKIITLSDPPFNSHWSGNTTDICPVGALTTRDFRFGARPWELTNVASICPHCPVGCSIVLSTRLGKIKRVMPRENDGVNEIWICDKGRFGHHFVGSKERLRKPLVRQELLTDERRTACPEQREGTNDERLEPKVIRRWSLVVGHSSFVEVDWETALDVVATRLLAVKAMAGPGQVGGLIGARVSNEDLYVFQKLLRAVLGTNNLDHRPLSLSRHPGDDVIYRLGATTGTNLGRLGQDTAILVVGADPDQEQPVLWLKLKTSATRGGATLITAVNRPTRLERYAKLKLRPCPGTESYLVLGLLATVLNEELENADFVASRVDGLDGLRSKLADYSPATVAALTGVAEADLRAAARAFAQATNGVILFGREAMHPAALQALANLALVTGHVGRPNNGLVALWSHNNTQGACDLGILPDRRPGYVLPVTPRPPVTLSPCHLVTLSPLGTAEMLEPGRLRALIVVARDPAGDDPRLRPALEQLDLLVVQDLFLTDTARLADVVLPAASFAEREGTFTNAERRVQRFYPAVPAPGEARPDWWILAEIARRMGYDWGYVTAADVLAEIRQAVPLYAGVTEEAPGLSRSRGRLASSNITDEGTRYEYLGDLDYQWPALAENPDTRFAVEWVAPEPQPTPADGSFRLVPTVLLYDRGTLISKSEILAPLIPDRHVELNAADATRLGIADGDRVRLTVEDFGAEVTARVDRRVPQGAVLIPESFGIPVDGRSSVILQKGT
jgi:NADH-quinone oxidoreductase subunit G